MISYAHVTMLPLSTPIATASDVAMPLKYVTYLIVAKEAWSLRVKTKYVRNYFTLPRRPSHQNKYAKKP